MGHPDAPPLSVSIVIPMYNEENYIGECLASLLHQDYPKELYEIIVVDGMSGDRSREIVLKIAEEHPTVRLLDNPKRITSAGLNIGVKQARGDMVNILGAHSYVAEDYLSQIVYYLHKTGADCVGPAWNTIGTTFQARAIALAMSSRFGVGNALYRVSKREGYVDTCGFATYRKEVFDKIGFFDEGFTRSNEDFEFNRRLINAGGKIYMTPAVKAYYYSRGSIKDLFRQYFRYGYWKIDVLKKVPGSFLFRYQIPVFFVLGLILTGIAGIFSKTALVLFTLIVGLYLSAAFVASLFIAIKSGLRYLIVLPFAFMALHFGFGLGFTCSLFSHLIRRRKRATSASEA